MQGVMEIVKFLGVIALCVPWVLLFLWQPAPKRKADGSYRQNTCLVGYALSELKQILAWKQFLARERQREEIAEFVARTRQFPPRSHVRNQVRLLGKGRS